MSDRNKLHRVIAEAACGVAPDDRAIALAALYVLRDEVLPTADEKLIELVRPAEVVLCAAYEKGGAKNEGSD